MSDLAYPPPTEQRHAYLLLRLLTGLDFFGHGFALTLAFLLMFVLMFGVTMKQDWATAGSQLLYGLILAILLFTRARYDLSWPSLLRTIRY